MESTSTGTYVAVTYSDETVKEILRWAKEQGIPNLLKPESIHTTLIYSRKELPDFVPHGDIEVKLSKEARLHVFENPGERVLVMKVDPTWLVARNEAITSIHGAEYDHDEYIPHISLSYDIGDFVVSNKPFTLKKAPVIINEYKEALNFDYKDEVK